MRSRYYRILGLPDNAPMSDVRKAYRKLVMQYHPDKNNAPGTEERFIEIKQAYEVLTGKISAPTPKATKRRSSRAASPTETETEEFKRRTEEAQNRYREQKLKELIDNERYFRKLTTGFRWKIMKASAIVGLVLSCFMLIDLTLPHHYSEDHITAYCLNPANGIGGSEVSLIDTEESGEFWVEGMNYSLYHGNHKIWIESSWILHNPMRILSQDKVRVFGFHLNFNIFRLIPLLIPLFLLPLFTIWYKRRKISFTVAYHFCFYGVNGIMIAYLLADYRWAHILTLGYL